jgi:hypothetical protein
MPQYYRGLVVDVFDEVEGEGVAFGPAEIHVALG